MPDPTGPSDRTTPRQEPTTEHRTAVVVLAAGGASRFGSAKQLASLGDRPMLTIVLATSLTAAPSLVPEGSSPARVRCVLGAHADAARAAVPDGVEVLVNPDWHTGLSSSLRTAIASVAGDPTLTAVSIALGDQPLVGADAHLRLHEAHRHGAQLAVATYGGRRANPVLLGRELWDEARGLLGDTGARQLMSRHRVTEVACDDTGAPDDVDRPEDLVAVRERLAPR